MLNDFHSFQKKTQLYSDTSKCSGVFLQFSHIFCGFLKIICKKIHLLDFFYIEYISNSKENAAYETKNTYQNTA